MNSRVSKITIARLFNTGNYEHCRIELTIDVPEGASAAEAYIGAERLINALNPKRPCGVPDRDESERQAAHITLMKGLTDEQFDQQYLGYGSKATRASYTQSKIEEQEQGVARRVAWEKRAREARRLLDDVGAAMKWRDAKLDWQDDDDQF